MPLNPPNPKFHYKTLISIFQRCKSMSEFKQTHAHLLINGLTHPLPSLRPIISFSSLHPSGDIDYGLLLLFQNLQTPPPLFLFNTIIRGLAGRLLLRDSLSKSVMLFGRIAEFGLKPNNFTFTFLFQACANCAAFDLGRQFQSTAVKNSVLVDTCVRNSIIQFYSVCGKLEDARRVFDESNELDVVSWNTLINGYVRSGEVQDALQLFYKMPERNVVSWNCLMSGLVRIGYMDDAHQVFYEMGERNIVSWAVMISGCSQNGWPKEALELFREMQLAGREPNAAILVSVISASSQLGALNQGKWIHAYIQKNHIRLDSILVAALIDMYAKCANIPLAMQVLSSISEKDVFTYTAAISGLAINGHGKDAVCLFEQMKSEGVAPDRISYIAVLCACSHMGWVEKGFYYFNSMVHADKIEAELDHYACMVDLLGRAGLLEEAERFIASMPIKPDNVIWGALLGACRIHNNVEIGKRVGDILIESDRHHDGRYVLLSNIYEESGKVDEAEEVRKTMKIRRIKRVPGCSVIEVNGVVHEFVAGDRSHERTYEIYSVWEEILREIKKVGYMEETKGVVFDVGEEKEAVVGHHSEKLAVAFGFISTEPGSMLCIVKNIRICRDCHTAIKLASMVFRRKIAVRDRKQFHHFEAGSCSCLDYW